jgi:ZIP family zinc transporter
MRLSWPLVMVGVIVVAGALGWWSAQDERVWLAYCVACRRCNRCRHLAAAFSRRFSARVADCCTDSCGVMLAASVFSLILPAMQALEQGGVGKSTGSLVIGASVLAGALLVLALQRAGQGHDELARQAALRRVWLFVLTRRAAQPAGRPGGVATAASRRSRRQC